MEGENGNGQKWLRKPQFSIEDIIKLAVFLGPWIMAGAVGILLFKQSVKDSHEAKITADSTYVISKGTRTLVKQLTRRADTLQAQVGKLATKVQVQHAIDQGNDVHRDQYRRIQFLERRSGMRPRPAHSDVQVYSWPRRNEIDVARGPTEDLWHQDPDGDEEDEP
jgi:hypothetical protein